MKLFAISVSVATTLVVTLAGQTAQQVKPVLGAGATLCSSWLGASRITQNADGSMTSTGSPKDPLQVGWILGYLSATGVTGPAAQPGGEGFVIGYVTGACQRDPTRTLASVVSDFAASMR